MKAFALALLVLSGCNPKMEKETFVGKSEIDSGQLVASLRLSEHANDSDAKTVTINELKTIYDADSVATLQYKISFLKGKSVLTQYSGEIKYVSEKGDWSIDQDIIAEKAGGFDRRFVHISNGYPACGYVHEHWLFYLGPKITLVKNWTTMTDGGFGTYTDFYPTFSNGKAESFSSVDVHIGDAEMKSDSIEKIEIAYSDSIHYALRKEKWIEKPITPKGKIFRKQELTSDQFYKE